MLRYTSCHFVVSPRLSILYLRATRYIYRPAGKALWLLIGIEWHQDHCEVYLFGSLAGGIKDSGSKQELPDS